ILSARLHRLVEDDILRVRTASDRTGRGEYQLTVKGRRLQIILLALWQWGAEHLYREGEAMSVVVETTNGQPIKPIELRAGDGRLLSVEEIAFRPGNKSRGPFKS